MRSRPRRAFGTTTVVLLLLAVRAWGAGEASALQWCAQDSATPSCTAQYAILAPQCIDGGFRSCLVGKARQAARTDNCAVAFKLARLCQCHNPTVRDALEQGAVCDWLQAN